MPDEKAPSSGAFLSASLMYFCSGQPMHYCSGVDSSEFGPDYMTLADALKACLAYGEDPAAFEPKVEPVEPKVDTFGEVAENWLIRHVDANKLRSAPDIRRELKKY